MTTTAPPGTSTDPYADAGVDTGAGAAAVGRIRSHLAHTARPECVALPGGFAGGFAFDGSSWRRPVLVSGADGVGTKLLVAAAMDRWDTIGVDAVAMCVNDIAVYGAEPLFFLDYLATGRVDPDVVEAIVAGVATGCSLAGCSLLGGETAEMPGMYAAGHADVAGCAVGVVERDLIPAPETTRAGDAIVGLASSGLHSNGYSLVRRVLLGDHAEAEDRARLCESPPGLGRTIGDELLEPTRIYALLARTLVAHCRPSAMAHVTGGGIPENLARVLPSHLDAAVDTTSWEVPPIFGLVQQRGGLDHATMHRVFNMGVGFVVVVPPATVGVVQAIAAEHAVAAWHIGEVVPGCGQVQMMRTSGQHGCEVVRS